MSANNVESLPPLFDAHNDSLILREARDDPTDFADVDASYHVDLPRLRAGNVGGLFVMVGDHDLAQSVRLIDAVCQMDLNHPDDFSFCGTGKDIKTARDAGRIALIAAIEGQAMFGEDLELLRQWHRLGVRIASLTHGSGKLAGRETDLQYDPACGKPVALDVRKKLRLREKGLTPFARESLAGMERLGMVLDLTHANDAAFWDALECYGGPVCCTHSNCYALCRHGRNLTDEMMKALAARGGVMGLCLYTGFVDLDKPGLDRFVDHMEHALELMGEDGVAIGTDADGLMPDQELLLEDVAGMASLWQAAASRIPEAILRKVWWDNLFRLLPEK